MQNIRACASIRNPTCAHPCRRCPGQTVVGCRRCGRHQSTCSSKKLHLEARASHSTSFGPVSSAQTHALSAEDLDGTISHSKQLQGQAQSSCRADQGSTIYLSSAPGLVGGILWGHPHDLAVMASVFSLHAATVVFICYMCSWLVYSDKPALSKHPLVAQLNNMRKASCKALQASHGVCALAAVTAVALDPASIAQLVPHLSVPLLMVASVSVLVLGSVELHRRQTTKAQALQLDKQGPGAAHPIMVQGAQSAAKMYVWVFLTGLHGYLSYTKGGWSLSSLLCALLLGTGGFCLWAGERDI